MKKITRISAGEHFTHKGDLTVLGNIEEGAVVNIQDGSLIVHGDILERAQVCVKYSQELANQSSFSSIGRSVFSSGGMTTIIGGGNINLSRVSQANISINGIYIGNVNINNRILTDGAVIPDGGDNYRIVYADGNDFSGVLRLASDQHAFTPTKMVSATVDGKAYRGFEIKVRGKEVIVDNQSAQALVPTEAREAKEQLLSPPKVEIKGTI